MAAKPCDLWYHVCEPFLPHGQVVICVKFHLDLFSHFREEDFWRFFLKKTIWLLNHVIDQGPSGTPHPLLSQQYSWRSPFIQPSGSHHLPWSFLGKPHFQAGLQSQSPTEHHPSSKVLPWHTRAPDHMQSFRPQPDRVLLSPLGCCSHLSPFLASCCAGCALAFKRN